MQSPFDTVWDVVIFGGGYAGFAAALRATDKRVLLIDREAGLLRESGWSFSERLGSGHDALWRDWTARLQGRGALRNDRCDGAIAEVLATELCSERGLPLLYYAAPIAAEYVGSLLASVQLATKSGARRICSSQWIDATESGELVALLDRRWRPQAAEQREWSLYFRSARWPVLDRTEIEDRATDLELHWSGGLWNNERTLTVTLPGAGDGGMEGWLPGLRALHGSGRVELGSAVLTHGSIVPFSLYASAAELPQMPNNVVQACGCLGGAQSATLYSRFERGNQAIELLNSRARCAGTPPNRAPEVGASNDAEECIDAEVIVAGLGTAGALAAVAAGRQGAEVAAFEMQPFAGGISSGGGIHTYWFGVRGGLQQELDDRVRQLMPLFGSPARVRGFHPDAKKLVLHQMLEEAGAAYRHGCVLYRATANEGRILSAATSSPEGPLRWRAQAWIDATGDGDLCAVTGADFAWGRSGDGRLAAYSQSSGRAGLQNDEARMEVINFDAGYCDPTDVIDLTRARLSGIGHYAQQSYDELDRPTYIAPALGVRQSRHIVTDYVLELSDLVERSRFDDAIGYAGGHLDIHARDFEFESDEALFWVWICGQHNGRLACPLPYRCLLPRDLHNVWIACRALGMTTDAHYCVRMQRDMQRVGEVAGYAAALSVSDRHQGRGVSRTVPYAELRILLEASGALETAAAREDSFGPVAQPASGSTDQSRRIGQLQAPDHWKGQLRSAPAGRFLWHLYRSRAIAEPYMSTLVECDDATESWRAAAIGAMWCAAWAEPRLLRAIEQREGIVDKLNRGPEGAQALCVPRWLAAISLLRRCGSNSCLPALEELAENPRLAFNARTAIALTVGALARRSAFGAHQTDRCLELLDRLLATQAPGGVRQIQSALPLGPLLLPQPPTGLAPRDRVIENFEWQLDRAIAAARVALQGESELIDTSYQIHANALVRRSFLAMQI